MNYNVHLCFLRLGYILKVLGIERCGDIYYISNNKINSFDLKYKNFSLKERNMQNDEIDAIVEAIPPIGGLSIMLGLLGIKSANDLINTTTDEVLRLIRKLK